MKKSTPKVLVLFVLSLILVAVSPVASMAGTFRTIVAFGDSLTDHFGLASYIGLYDPVKNPNGALEAWTNGDVWVEYLADELNAELDNNAIAGAMTRGHENNNIQALVDAGKLPPLGLVGQINRFVNENVSFNPETTLFTIWIGGNDLLEYGRGESDVADTQELISNAIDNIINSMSALASDGAKNILVINLPDLGKTPAYNSRSPQEIQAVTALTAAFNAALAQGIDGFKTVFPNVTLISYDIFTNLNQIISSDTFANVTGTYMVLDENGNRTGATNEPAADYLFWDAIHPTTRAHQIVADEINDKLAAMGIKPVHDDDDSTCFVDTLGLVSNW